MKQHGGFFDLVSVHQKLASDVADVPNPAKSVLPLSRTAFSSPIYDKCEKTPSNGPGYCKRTAENRTSPPWSACCRGCCVFKNHGAPFVRWIASFAHIRSAAWLSGSPTVRGDVGAHVPHLDADPKPRTGYETGTHIGAPQTLTEPRLIKRLRGIGAAVNGARMGQRRRASARRRRMGGRTLHALGRKGSPPKKRISLNKKRIRPDQGFFGRRNDAADGVFRTARSRSRTLSA